MNPSISVIIHGETNMEIMQIYSQIDQEIIPLNRHRPKSEYKWRYFIFLAKESKFKFILWRENLKKSHSDCSKSFLNNLLQPYIKLKKCNLFVRILSYLVRWRVSWRMQWKLENWSFQLKIWKIFQNMGSDTTFRIQLLQVRLQQWSSNNIVVRSH